MTQVGAKYERQLKRLFEENGWKAVRSAGSMGTGDLILLGVGTNNPRVVIAEVKSLRGKNTRNKRGKAVFRTASTERTKEQYKELQETYNWMRQNRLLTRGWTVAYFVRRTWGSRTNRWMVHELPFGDVEYPILYENNGITLSEFFSEDYDRAVEYP